MAGEVPIRESVGAAFAFARVNLRFIGMVAAIGALVSTAASAAGVFVAPLSIFTNFAASITQACVYAAFVNAALLGASAVRERWLRDGMRVWVAMLIIGFFLFLVMFVLTIVIIIALAAGPLGAYASDLESAGSDQAQVLAVMARFAQENPIAILIVFLVYAVVWLGLTSRLYLAAPATLEAKRILTFETWNWTKGSVLRITGARLLLLAPANILVGTISYLIGRPLGINSLDPASAEGLVASNPAAILIYIAVTTLVTFAIYTPLEAGLSSYLYRGLKPAATPPTSTPPPS
jgi:hypothetical protein